MAARLSTTLGTSASKGGHDYEFVIPPPKSLECPICLLTLCDPHVISCCGNEFCQVCIERVKRDGKPCPLCNEQGFSTMLHKKLLREVNALVIRCPQREMGCDWKGELGHVQSHLCMTCRYITVPCTYHCGAELQRRQLAEHERDFCPNRPVEMQVASLAQKLESILLSNQLLRKELAEVKQAHRDEIKRIQIEHQQELEGVKKKYNEVIKHSELQRQDVMKAIDVMKGYNVQPDESLKDELKTELREEMKLLVERENRSLSLRTIPLPLPPFYFTLNNTEHYKKKNFCWYSNPFYSQPGGYKVVIAVYPNGRGRALGSHLSVFVNVIRGEFDDHLEWPCSGAVTLEAWKQTACQWTYRRSIPLCPARDEEYVQKPVNFRRNRGMGILEYIQHSELPDFYTTHIKGDAVEFRVLSVLINN